MSCGMLQVFVEPRRTPTATRRVLTLLFFLFHFVRFLIPFALSRKMDHWLRSEDLFLRFLGLQQAAEGKRFTTMRDFYLRWRRRSWELFNGLWHRDRNLFCREGGQLRAHSCIEEVRS